MSEYVIFTDSGCDIDAQTLAEWGVDYRSLTFRFNDSDKEYSNGEMSPSEFYQKMRDGGIAKTAAVNVGEFASAFEDALKAGKDVLYLGFSSGLSTTYNSGRLAAEQLRSQYPERKIITVDTLSASAGVGLLVYLTVQKKNEGASIEEAAEFAKNMISNLCIWFTVDDLVYLKRGGRVSPTAAFVGNMLGIKPILNMDMEGHLIPISKVRGRKTSITTLADKYTELATDHSQPVFISHGDCLADAEALADLIHTRHGAEIKIITHVGPVIGAHSGPGTIALFFVGKGR